MDWKEPIYLIGAILGIFVAIFPGASVRVRLNFLALLMIAVLIMCAIQSAGEGVVTSEGEQGQPTESDLSNDPAPGPDDVVGEKLGHTADDIGETATHRTRIEVNNRESVQHDLTGGIGTPRQNPGSSAKNTSRPIAVEKPIDKAPDYHVASSLPPAPKVITETKTTATTFYGPRGRQRAAQATTVVRSIEHK